MKSPIATIVFVFIVIVTLGVDSAVAQPTATKRNFDAEIQAALESAKTAAGFDHLGTLVRTCLLPQSGGEDANDALPRYIGAVACMWALSSTTLTLLKHFDYHYAFRVGHFPLDLDIVATQFFLAGLKFFLYHKWVFPVPKET